ncbi:hypothetical protein FNU76_23150 [Chitinimonas arctica]|uniref:Uncharacterized protein n=1 Tax=Chitinimonas arctica TaxID=2594795 RepID=A0A516SLH4_9NEIS|nr:hypothetical protein [Chitinimonas arctica]QDQ29010.1 hypothetical protein FNU76_23150 [Chitinimonas arctica]
MKYELKPLTQPDREAILRDMAPFLEQSSMLATLSHEDAMPQARAIDQERHSYLLGLSPITRLDSSADYYCFFLEKRPYVFFTENMFSDTLFQEAGEDATPLPAHVKEAILEAFRVYGRFGRPDGFSPIFLGQ